MTCYWPFANCYCTITDHYAAQWGGENVLYELPMQLLVTGVIKYFLNPDSLVSM